MLLMPLHKCHTGGFYINVKAFVYIAYERNFLLPVTLIVYRVVALFIVSQRILFAATFGFGFNQSGALFY